MSTEYNNNFNEDEESLAQQQEDGEWINDSSPEPTQGRSRNSATIIAHGQLDLIERFYAQIESIGSLLFVEQVANIIKSSKSEGELLLTLDTDGVWISKKFRRHRQRKYRVELDKLHVSLIRLLLSR